MIHDPRRIKRIGLAVEMEDGEQIMFYTESPTAEIQFETNTEFKRWHDGMIVRPMPIDRQTEITISGIRGYKMHSRAPESTARAIDRIHEITGGNPDDYR
ncbi:hypothetical protein CIK76_04955 [Glutamicibacter sp. BW80]|uniref:hypothetical protein n=1 Tax=Glutamicibacter sp. BW80 TaxID=2024404 RepID=UPI000BB7D27B|nr:hypothetical protein [Glutamicibacter sp. BW80]PCC29745.1 hypothetical protein CIK76_04955 [Glutamicibacter sp. BW80]